MSISLAPKLYSVLVQSNDDLNNISAFMRCCSYIYTQDNVISYHIHLSRLCGIAQ